MVKGKGKGLDGVEFKFLDPRRAAFKVNNMTYAAKLVDLPNIIEAQKTFDNRHLFKIADISQMLIVENPVADEASITEKPLKIDEYIWPHGITPPMKHVRKRRFRKRMSRLAIEVVEESVEDLLKKDDEAEDTAFDLIDVHQDPDIDDQYYIDYDPNGTWQNYNQGDMGSEYGGSEMYDDPGSVAPSQMEDWGEGGTDWGTEMGDEGEGDYEREEEDDGDDGTLDQELAAALMEGTGGSEFTGLSEDDGATSGSEDDDDDDEGDKSEYDEETLEKRAKIKQFTSEIKALETVIDKKRAGFTGGNPIMVKRFEETIAGLQADVTAKIGARQALVDELGKAEEGSTMEAAKQKEEAAEVTAVGEGVEHRDVKESTVTTETPMDVDLDEGGDGYSEAPTPVAVKDGEQASSPHYSDGDDLFGDDDDDEDAEAVQAHRGEGDVVEQGDDEEDEMARLLRAELDGLDPNAVDETPDMTEDQAQVDAAASAALDSFAMSDAFGQFPAQEDTGSLGGFDFTDSMEQITVPGFVEGGVGRRRLAMGAEAGDIEDESSEDSDD